MHPTRKVLNFTKSPNLVAATPVQWQSRSPGPVSWLSRSPGHAQWLSRKTRLSWFFCIYPCIREYGLYSPSVFDCPVFLQSLAASMSVCFCAYDWQADFGSLYPYNLGVPFPLCPCGVLRNSSAWCFHQLVRGVNAKKNISKTIPRFYDCNVFSRFFYIVWIVLGIFRFLDIK